ncbi:hypothetical protein ED733_001183 [Metarhizium rileyi]|uniref:Tyrosine-protein phosphatase domain-containing protein n=1 Tax=Metarhizium rileyi (strain RCEF 4871) TaxID=1649241 RepID=A0A5C6GLX1_METRR|nr:hypothetical protein ED733_001183 [Metarhizium rileyi]
MSPAASSRERLNTSISANTIRSAPYSYQAPSPPFIHIPVPQRHSTPEAVGEPQPSYKNIESDQLSSQDVQIITRSTIQVDLDHGANWTYKNRRQAQTILDFLYLGPTSVILDHDFLMREGITMMLVVRPVQVAQLRARSVESASSMLKIPAFFMHVDSTQDLIRGFADAIRRINHHLLDMYRSHAVLRNDDERVAVSPVDFRPGKVLVTCESGNDRSAAIVAAYVMSVFGTSMVKTLHFMWTRRFSCAFDEETKRILQSWEDILLARSAVAQHTQRQSELNRLPGESEPRHDRASNMTPASKRRLDEMMATTTIGCHDTEMAPVADLDRFIDRAPFVPFADALDGD